MPDIVSAELYPLLILLVQYVLGLREARYPSIANDGEHSGLLRFPQDERARCTFEEAQFIVRLGGIRCPASEGASRWPDGC